MQLREFNALPADEAEKHVLTCARIPAWASAVAAARPYDSTASALQHAADIALTWDAADVAAAMADHPRIGEKHTGDAGQAEASRSEQSGVSQDELTQRRLREGNAAYEARFDRVFLIRAAGRDALQILAELERRLRNDDATEARESAAQLREIALLRLGGLLQTEIDLDTLTKGA